MGPGQQPESLEKLCRSRLFKGIRALCEASLCKEGGSSLIKDQSSLHVCRGVWGEGCGVGGGVVMSVETKVLALINAPSDAGCNIVHSFQPLVIFFSKHKAVNVCRRVW